MIEPRSIFQTYSIVARNAESGAFGVAVQTHQMCVGAVVPWLQVGVGAIATQAMTNVSFGPIGLAMLETGLTADQTLEGLLATDEGRDGRQLAIVDERGITAAWTGQSCIAHAGHHTGNGYSVQANMMQNTTVIDAMAKAYERASGDLAERMLIALQAAQHEGGDIRGMQSAALKVVQAGSADDEGTRFIPRYDLRVDEHDQPVEELARLVRLRSAQLKSNDGFALGKKGDLEQALRLWAEARASAPELEELGFWQAVALADDERDITCAAAILGPILNDDLLRDHWVDLIRRIQACGIIERDGVAQELITALESFWQDHE